MVERHLPQVDETALGQEDDVTARRHGEAVNLRLDVHGLLGVSLQPGNINLNVEVANAAFQVSNSIEVMWKRIFTSRQWHPQASPQSALR